MWLAGQLVQREEDNKVIYGLFLGYNLHNKKCAAFHDKHYKDFVELVDGEVKYSEFGSGDRDGDWKIVRDSEGKMYTGPYHIACYFSYMYLWVIEDPDIGFTFTPNGKKQASNYLRQAKYVLSTIEEMTPDEIKETFKDFTFKAAGLEE